MIEDIIKIERLINRYCRAVDPRLPGETADGGSSVCKLPRHPLRVPRRADLGVEAVGFAEVAGVRSPGKGA